MQHTQLPPAVATELIHGRLLLDDEIAQLMHTSKPIAVSVTDALLDNMACRFVDAVANTLEEVFGLLPFDDNRSTAALVEH